MEGRRRTALERMVVRGGLSSAENSVIHQNKMGE